MAKMLAIIHRLPRIVYCVTQYTFYFCGDLGSVATLDSL